jgi:hypothetical protein
MAVLSLELTPSPPRRLYGLVSDASAQMAVLGAFSWIENVFLPAIVTGGQTSPRSIIREIYTAVGSSRECLPNRVREITESIGLPYKALDLVSQFFLGEVLAVCAGNDHAHLGS